MSFIDKLKEYFLDNYETFCPPHEGLSRYIGNRRDRGFANSSRKMVIRLTDEIGNILFASEKDINWQDETVKEYERTIRSLYAEYYLGSDDFRNGVALICWTVLPDGRYFEDEDGFGGESHNEVNIYCYIGKTGKVLVPFQGMTKKQIEEFRVIAEKMV